MPRKKSAKAKPTKRSRKPEPQAEVLEAVESGGAGVDEGIILTTFVLLAGAVYLIWSLLGDRYPDSIV